MKLPEIGVKRPVATAMLFVAIILLGLVAMISLNYHYYDISGCIGKRSGRTSEQTS